MVNLYDYRIPNEFKRIGTLNNVSYVFQPILIFAEFVSQKYSTKHKISIEVIKYLQLK